VVNDEGNAELSLDWDEGTPAENITNDGEFLTAEGAASHCLSLFPYSKNYYRRNNQCIVLIAVVTPLKYCCRRYVCRTCAVVF